MKHYPACNDLNQILFVNVLFYFSGIDCNAGYYSLGGTSDCIACPGGSECSDPAVAPVQCLAGTYAPPANDTCISCEAGYRCPTDGLSDQEACPAGYYQTGTGQTSCTQCGQGKV